MSFYYIVNVFSNFHILIKSFYFFIIACIHLVSSKYILYVLTFGKNMHKGLVFL